MWQRNNGRAEEELQIKFTGYLIQAVRRTQRDYLKALYAYSNQETLTDTIFAVSQTLEQEVMERLTGRFDIDEIRVLEPSLNDIFVEYTKERI